jgi:RNA recognition motif-containing protein
MNKKETGFLAENDELCSENMSSTSTSSNVVPQNQDSNKIKIFIGGLNYITTSEDLKSYFKTFGAKVTKCIVVSGEKGYSKCYGFVDIEVIGFKGKFFRKYFLL